MVNADANIEVKFRRRDCHVKIHTSEGDSDINIDSAVLPKLFVTLNNDTVVTDVVKAIGLEVVNDKRYFGKRPFEIYDIALHASPAYEAVKKTAEKIRAMKPEPQSVLIVGDKDADGITSTALAYMLVQEVYREIENIDIEMLQSHRGYNHDAWDIMASYDLVVFVDFGTRLTDELYLWKKEHSTTHVLVIDHHLHENEERLSEHKVKWDEVDIIEFNPTLYGDGSLCAAGATLAVLYELVGHKIWQTSAPWWAAIGNLGDMVPMKAAINWSVLRHVLDMPALPVWLQKLIDTDTITLYQLSYRVVPMLNSIARMNEDPIAAVMHILSHADNSEYLHEINEKRKMLVSILMSELTQHIVPQKLSSYTISDTVTKPSSPGNEHPVPASLPVLWINLPTKLINQAIKMVYYDNGESDKDSNSLKGTKHYNTQDAEQLITENNELVQGVVGLIAGRLSERYGVPSFVGALVNDYYYYSARSRGIVPVFDLIDKLVTTGIADIGGGHHFAGGVTIHKDKVSEAERFAVRFYTGWRAFSSAQQHENMTLLEEGVDANADQSKPLHAVDEAMHIQSDIAVVIPPKQLSNGRLLSRVATDIVLRQPVGTNILLLAPVDVRTTVWIATKMGKPGVIKSRNDNWAFSHWLNDEQITRVKHSLENLSKKYPVTGLLLSPRWSWKHGQAFLNLHGFVFRDNSMCIWISLWDVMDNRST